MNYAKQFDFGLAIHALKIGMRTADGAYVPWLASQSDMLAEDWVIVD